MEIKHYLVKPDSKIKLSDFKTGETDTFESKEKATEMLEKNILEMAEQQALLYAQDKFSLLIIFQAMDAAGKDGAIKHVMSGLNPQSTQVHSFKAPSLEELDHDFLWRINKALPEKGKIGIFNRSHYEEVLIVRVHNLIKNQKIPEQFINDNIWKLRYNQINNFERYLYENGTYVIKFFLHISKEEQKKRFIKRIDDPSKNWKFGEEDIKERNFWDEYQKCYQEAISETSKKHASWYIIPSDKKWFARLVISEIIVKTLKSMDLKYPNVDDSEKERLKLIKEMLKNEKE
ncbi:MAG: polyphosphate kinase 2 family protein [Ignavibacteriales bacterium]|nr:polyphosphate kinase 2 family protein [Ignavibacteriales bacterium]